MKKLIARHDKFSIDRNFNFKTILKLSSIFLLITSCQKKESGGTTTGNPLTLSITSSNQNKTIAVNTKTWMDRLLLTLIPRVNALPPPTLLVDALDNNVQLNEAWTVIKEVEFKNTEATSNEVIDGAEISLPGPYIINLFSSTPTSIGTTEVNYTNLKRIKMKYSKAESSVTINEPSAPAGLNGKSIYLSGSVNNNSFIFSSSEEIEYEVSGPNSVTLSYSTSHFLISINIANLIRKINLSSITNNSATIDENNKISVTNPCPLIDSSAQDLYTCFQKGLKSEANFGKDSDGSGELETNEESVKD